MSVKCWSKVVARTIAGAIATAAAAASAPTAALAQVPSAQPPSSQPRSFSIPPQPLADGLTAFGRQSGLQVSVDAALVRGQSTAGVSGTLTPVEALNTLLAGTGIVYRFVNATTVTLERPAGAGGAAASGTLQLDPVRVQGNTPPPQAEIGNLPSVYAGGQVARGGKAGLLGNRDYMDMPFSETVYTDQYIQSQQARTLTDVLAGDPTVRLGWPNGNVFDDRVMIRGILVQNPNYGLGGVYGIVPNQVDTTGIERVEVFRGPTAFLNGALPSAVGGTINLVPKRATDRPITQVAALYLSDAQFGGTADVGRRFGPDNALGVRANATYTNGETSVNNQTAERLSLTLGLDYRGDDTRIDADIGFQKRNIGGFQGGMFLAAGVQLPAPPNARNSSYQPWERLQTDDLYGALRFEHDITPGLTGFIKVGGRRTNTTSVFMNQNIVNYNGNTTVLSAGQYRSMAEVLSAEVGARATFRTGPVKHEAALVGDYLKTMNYSLNNPLAIASSSNIYNPTFIAAPMLTGLNASTPLTSDSLYTSIGVVDTLSFAEDRVQIIGGARLQRLQTANYLPSGLPANGADQAVVSPSVSFVVKPTKEVMVYGNYIQALQQGPTAGAGLTNAGQTFPPFVTNQFELGVKLDFGSFGATLSAFQITMPSSYTDFTTNTLVTDGQQRNRGLEFVAFGEPLPGLKFLGGFTLLDAKLTSTAGGLNNGNTAVGTAPFQVAAGLDWDTPYVKGLGVSGRVVYNGQVFLNPANTQSAPPWTRIDAGVRYTFERADGKPLTLRANVTNLFDANYWVATTSFFAQNQPRTFMLSLTADF